MSEMTHKEWQALQNYNYDRRLLTADIRDCVRLAGDATDIFDLRGIVNRMEDLYDELESKLGEPTSEVIALVRGLVQHIDNQRHAAQGLDRSSAVQAARDWLEIND